ncbi:Calmodulin-binding protein 60 C [Bienertia sinuspersici]
MKNTMNFVSEKEQLQLKPHDQNKPPEGCLFDGATNLRDMTVQQFKALIEEIVERVLDRKLNLPSNSSSLPHHAESSVSRSFQLHFKGELPEKILTKNNIEDEGGSLVLELCDDTGKRVQKVGPEMKNLKVRILPLDGDFKVEDNDNYTEEDFRRHIAIPRDDKPPLLKGNYDVSLNNGFARFKEKWKVQIRGSSHKRSSYGEIVRPAVSKAFRVKEYRLKDDQKHAIPFPQDELWRLVNINKNGRVYQRAVTDEILTVLDFLQLYKADARKLQEILKLTGKKWKDTVENAEACNLTNELYKYKYLDDASGDVLKLDCAFNVESVTFKGQASQPYEFLDKYQKEKVCRLRQAAYGNRKDLEKVYDFTNWTPVQAGLGYPSQVEQTATESSSMDSNVDRPCQNAGVVGLPSYQISSTSPINTATDQSSFGQQAACLNTDDNGVANNWLPVLDFTAANQGETSQLYESPDDFLKEQAEEFKRIADKEQSDLEKVIAPTIQISDHEELARPSGIIQQEHHHQGHQQQYPTLAPPIGVCENPNAHVFDQICSISSSPFLPVDPTTPYQGNLTGTMLDSSHENGGLQKGFVRQYSMTYDQLFEDLLHSCPPQVERHNRDSVTSKLITTCYVTKAAALFMISVQQDPTSPRKKRKLQ